MFGSQPNAFTTETSETDAPKNNIALAIIAGTAAALVGAIIWAVFTVMTEFKIGIVSIGLGFLVGYVVAKCGRAASPVYGFIAAALSLIGCIVGDFFILIGFVSANTQTSCLDILSEINWGAVPQAMIDTGSPMDLLFYAFATYQGFKIASRG